ncbi:MAG: hypothetical protein ACRCV5_19005 [Afipia sp.]
MPDILTVAFVVFAVFGCGVILMTLLSGINEDGGKDEHEDGGF